MKTPDHSDMVDFIIRENGFTEHDRERWPYAVKGKRLTGGYTVLYVPENLVGETMEGIDGSLPRVLGLLGEDDLVSAGILPVQRQPYLDLRGRGVLLGFVDTGIDYTNHAFRYEDGTTRIPYLWDQSVQGNAPDGYFFGTEYTRTQIDGALVSENPRGVVPHTDTVGHGTFLASLAANREEGERLGAAPDAELIVVKLRRAKPYSYKQYLVPEEQENAFSTGDVMQGIEYILQRSFALKRPVAICLGLGGNFSGHNGADPLEAYLAQVAAHTGVIVCTAVGNEAVAGHHAQGVLTKTHDEHDLEIRVGKKAGSFCVQVYSESADRISIAITSPSGAVVRLPVKAGARHETELGAEGSRAEIEYHFPMPGSGDQLSVIRLYHPVPGIWKLTLYGDSLLMGVYHAWLPLTGFVPEGVEFLTPAPHTTVTSPAASPGVIRVGAYDGATNGLYVKSSWGPDRRSAVSPDFLAPGVQARGIYPTGPGVMTGTSAAAAIAAGACALLLQWGIAEKNRISMDTASARAYMVRGCDRTADITYPNDRQGYGNLNLFRTFTQLHQ